MIRDESAGIKSLTSMIGKAVIKFAWVFPELDFFNKLKLVSTYLLTGFHMQNKFSPENDLIRKTILETILIIFLNGYFDL